MSTARKLILYVIYFVVVVALGVAIIFAFSGKTPSKKPVIKAPGTVHYTNNSPDSKSPSQAQPTQASPATDTSGESVKAAIAAANSPTRLTNTGPGNVVAMFIVSTIAGSLAFRRRQLNRLSRLSS